MVKAKFGQGEEEAGVNKFMMSLCVCVHLQECAMRRIRTCLSAGERERERQYSKSRTQETR